MSTEQRQDRTERPSRGGRGGRGRGNYTSTRGGGRGGHARQQSFGYQGGYPAQPQMFAGPGTPGGEQQFMPVMPAHIPPGTMAPGVGYPPFPQPYQSFSHAPPADFRTVPVKSEPAKLVQKAETKPAALDFKAQIAARIAAQKGGAAAPTAAPKEVEAKPEVKPAHTQAELKPEAKPEAAPAKAPAAAPAAAPAPKAAPAAEPKEVPSAAPAAAPASNMKEAVLARLRAQKAAKEAEVSKATKAEETPKAEPKAEPMAEPKAEPKEATPEAKAEAPKEELKEEPKEPTAPTKELEELSIESTSKAPEASAPEAAPEVATETNLDAAPEASAPTLDSKWAEDKAEEKEDDEAGQAFFEQLKSAKLVGESQTYPEDIEAPAGASSASGALYSVDFLYKFRPLVPAINRKALREIVNVEAQKGQRSMSSRRGGSMHRDGGRMSRNASNASLRGGGGRNNSRRQGGRQGSSRKDKDEPPVPVAPLVRGENAWVPRTLKVTDDGKVESAAPVEPTHDLMDEAEVERRVKSLLNKMSLDNLDRIAAKIIDIANQSKHEPDCRTLKQIVALTFDKACDEPHWSAMYAKFCLKLHDVDPTISDESIIVEGKPISGQRLFRRILLNRCQAEFEKGWGVEETEENVDVMSDAYYAAVKAKRHGLGLVRFVGELFKSQFVSERIIHSCFVKLAKEKPTEEIVESTCKLVTTTAPYIQSKELLDYAMGMMRTWRTTPGFPSRLRFMIMDVEDANQNGWKVEDKGPKTLAEVHREVEIENARNDSGHRPGRGGPGGAFGSARRPPGGAFANERNERDTQRRMDRERQRVQNSTARNNSPRPQNEEKKEAAPASNPFEHLS